MKINLARLISINEIVQSVHLGYKVALLIMKFILIIYQYRAPKNDIK